MQREESAAKSNVQVQDVFYLPVLRQLTLSLFSDTETTCTEVDIKIKGQALRKGRQNIAIAKVVVGLRG